MKDREQEFVKYLYREGETRITDMIELGYSASTASNTFKTLEEQGLVEKLPNKKRALTPLCVFSVSLKINLSRYYKIIFKFILNFI